MIPVSVAQPVPVYRYGGSAGMLSRTYIEWVPIIISKKRHKLQTLAYEVYNRRQKKKEERGRNGTSF
jgi:hypothetical protein